MGQGRQRTADGSSPRAAAALGPEADWQPDAEALARVSALLTAFRGDAMGRFGPLAAAHYPALLDGRDGEYRKMVELSTKMAVVGCACTEIAGHDFDARRRDAAILFGGLCFFADSFVDDFGPAATEEYLDRIERLLMTGWFEVRDERERLFYVVLTRLFAQRDVLQPLLRQSILLLFEAQRRDVALRAVQGPGGDSRRLRLRRLHDCARDRSGHAICVLTGFLVPDIPLGILPLLFGAGALIMQIDDHGDCYADLAHRRMTYMNQLRSPAAALRRIFALQAARLHAGLPPGPGRDLMLAFLTRYYLTRLEKHRHQRRERGPSWTVYE
jgi:hypothetical protein